MILARSLAFNALFYLNLTMRLVVFSPIFLLGPEAACWWVVRGWARSSLWLLDRVGGVRSVFSGRRCLPSGPVIVASKHQSFWDVVAIVPELDRATFILKKELMSIPIFGWYAKRLAMIPIDRKARGGAVGSMIAGARKAAAAGRQIVIFPEGTRTAPGAEADYRRGVFRLYEALDLAVVPVALNSGLYWPRHRFARYPGTIDAEFLPPIGRGLSREDFFGSLHGAIESRSDELLVKSYLADGRLPAAEAAAEAVRRRAHAGASSPQKGSGPDAGVG